MLKTFAPNKGIRNIRNSFVFGQNQEKTFVTKVPGIHFVFGPRVLIFEIFTLFFIKISGDARFYQSNDIASVICLHFI